MTQHKAAPGAQGFALRGPGEDSALFRRVFGAFATGVAVASCMSDDGRRIGITINSLASVSLKPPLALFCLEKTSHTLAEFLRAGHFALNILPEGFEAVSTRFARDHLMREEEADGALESGAPVLRGALAVADCRLCDSAGGGDHVILIGHVLALAAQAQGAPLIYYGGDYARLAVKE